MLPTYKHQPAQPPSAGVVNTQANKAKKTHVKKHQKKNKKAGRRSSKLYKLKLKKLTEKMGKHSDIHTYIIHTDTQNGTGNMLNLLIKMLIIM